MADAATKLSPEEQKAVDEARKQSDELMSRVGRAGGIQHTALGVMVERAQKAGEPVSMALVPKGFILTLDGTARETIQFVPGVHPVPAAFLKHWYVIANGVKEYQGTAVPGRAQPILSSNVFADDPGVDAAAIDDITVAAYTLSGLTTQQWNELPPEERGAQMRAIYNFRNEAAERAKAATEKPRG